MSMAAVLRKQEAYQVTTVNVTKDTSCLRKPDRITDIVLQQGKQGTGMGTSTITIIRVSVSDFIGGYLKCSESIFFQP